MSWNYTNYELSTYLQELAAVSSPTCCSGTDPCAPSSLKSTPEASLNNGSVTDTCPASLSGMTSEPSTESLGKDSLTSSVEASPVRTYPPQVKVQDLPEAVQAFGSKCCESLTKFGLSLSSRKTVRTCVPVDSAPSSKDLTAWGMTFDGACWELGTSVRITSGTECGYWPTPTASAGGPEPPGVTWRKLATVVAMLPTPTSQDAKNNGSASQQKRNTKPLNAEIGGPLNPTWVEWLMGWPLGWTDLKPLEMGKFRSWLQLHGVC